jgi:hypothetical protein
MIAARRAGAGVSLTALTEILAEIGIPFVEDDLQSYDIVNADEPWLPTTATGSLARCGAPYCPGGARS